jgi:uncharacterized protein
MTTRLRRPLNIAKLGIVLLALSLPGGQGALAAATVANERPCATLTQKATAVGAQDVYQANALLISAARAGCVDLAKHLLTVGANLDGRDRFGATALSRAAEAGQDAMIGQLLGAGADVNARSVSGSTPLFMAAESGRVSTVRLLLAQKADPNLPGRGGLRPLAAAAFNGEGKMVDALLASGAEPNAIDDTGKAAIVYAASKGYGAIVRRLAEAGVDLNRKYDHSLNVLMWTAGYADEAGVDDILDVLGFLGEKGVALNEKDDRGKSALAIARELHHKEVVDFLVARGAVDDAASASTQSPAK